MKKKINKEVIKEMKNKDEDKKQVVNRKILEPVRIVVGHIIPIDSRGKAELDKTLKKMS